MMPINSFRDFFLAMDNPQSIFYVYSSIQVPRKCLVTTAFFIC